MRKGAQMIWASFLKPYCYLDFFVMRTGYHSLEGSQGWSLCQYNESWGRERRPSEPLLLQSDRGRKKTEMRADTQLRGTKRSSFLFSEGVHFVISQAEEMQVR